MELAFKANETLALDVSVNISQCHCRNKRGSFRLSCTPTAPIIVYLDCRETFCWLPLAYCINRKVLVLHGGLFKEDGVTLADIRAVDRFREPPDSGIMCDILWSDPQPEPGRAPSKRGCGVQFGPDVTQEFLDANGLELVIRSHEVKEDGYEIAHNGRCITVFSAPNYCDNMGNKGAFIILHGSDMVPHFKQFTAVPHPEIRPMAYADMSLFGGLL